MANITEVSAFDATVYQIPTTDPVQGGADTAIANKQAKSLADRTRYLYDQVVALVSAVAALAGTASPAFTGNPTAPTPATGDDSTSIATTAFVHKTAHGVSTLDVSGNSNVTLDAAHWGVSVLILIGTLTGSINVIFPTRGDRWLVVNRTTGLFTITAKTAAGTGVKVAQGRQKGVWCDGTDILDEETDLSIRPKKATSAQTMGPGDQWIVDQSGGAFAMTLPASPALGDAVDIFGNFKTTNLTVARNGQSTYDATGTAVASDILLNRNNLRAHILFDGTAWMAT